MKKCHFVHYFRNIVPLKQKNQQSSIFLIDEFFSTSHLNLGQCSDWCPCQHDFFMSASRQRIHRPICIGDSSNQCPCQLNFCKSAVDSVSLSTFLSVGDSGLSVAHGNTISLCLLADRVSTVPSVGDSGRSVAHANTISLCLLADSVYTIPYVKETVRANAHANSISVSLQ